MRFVLAFSFLFLFGGHAADLTAAQTAGGYEVLAEAPAGQALQKRRRGSSEKPVVDPGLQARVFAAQIGDVAAMAMDDDGAIYVADQTRGRILQLVDRALDGRIDLRRVVARDLDAPSGVAVIGERLFIADARAVWETPLSGGKLTRVADLSNSQALPFPRLLWPSVDGQSLILAISADAPKPAGKIVSININTGQARLIASGDGQISALAVGANDRIWVGSKNVILPVSGGRFLRSEGLTLGSGVKVNGLVLPGQFEKVNSALDAWSDHVFAAQSHAQRMPASAQSSVNILAVPTNFGQLSEGIETFADGFSDRSGRSAWGQPGTILMDERGMFVADRWSGAIWLINKAPPAPVKTDEPQDIYQSKTAQTDPAPQTELRPTGSSIKVGSKIEYGTGIKSGSSIPKEEVEPDPDIKASDAEE